MFSRRKDAISAGEVRYFTGTPCKYGHVAERFSRDGACLECVRIRRIGRADYHKKKTYEWRAKNPDRERENQRKRIMSNPDKAKAARAKSYEKHADKRRAHARAAHQKHKEEKCRASREYYWANREASLERNNRWRLENPEAAKAIKLNRRIRLRAAGQPTCGKVAAENIAAILKRQKGRCACCGVRAKLEMDHIMPLALGGSGDRTNFQGLCRPCNLSKHAKHPVDFNRSRGLLL